MLMLGMFGPSKSRSRSTSSDSVSIADRNMSTGFIRMHEQLRAVWKARDKDHPLVRGMLLTGAGNERKVLERWFTVVGHALFYCSSRESPEFSGVFFTDIFNPVVAKVNGRTLGAFDASDKEVCTSMCDVDASVQRVLRCAK